MLCKNYIDGKWVESNSHKTFESINPANGEVLGVITKSDAADVEEAVQAARNAFPHWRAVPAPRLAEMLFKVGQLMQSRKEELSELVTREMGKVINEGRGDVQEGIDMTFYMAGEGRRLFGQTTPAELPNKFAMSIREPVGVIAAITPWNFPIAIPTWKLMPALVAGNTVVFKPASDTPLLGAKLVEILDEAGIPPGVVNLLFGPGGVVGDSLVDHPGVDLVSFTGSTESGSRVAQRAVRGNKRISLEMGGKNAIIVMDDADLDLAIQGIVWSAFGTTGQRCTACSRVIVHEAVERELTDRLLDSIGRLRLGDGLDKKTDIGPVINASQLKKIESYVQIGRREGAQLLVGGEVHADGECAKGFFFKPTLFADVRPDMRIAQEEIFGPVCSIIRVKSLEDAIEVNNRTPYGLSSSIYTRDVNRAFAAVRDISTGIVYVNAGTIGAEVHLPFGGTRGTGNGHREAGQAALDIFTEWKSVYFDFSGKLQRAQIDLD